ncbi:hypothetical protein BOX15_Mlig012742g1 [Macrostomum lignano]|uniref:Mab-21-like HhH/H2TH-like domain-containing protein n=1 Tax=Macrostomum lignano TaxID=282301 RepID=A0A267FAU1_9PLAT|nr:hypothetical protein BOX15_Mlig012742g1 [Macrostomum lignano]
MLILRSILLSRLLSTIRNGKKTTASPRAVSSSELKTQFLKAASSGNSRVVKRLLTKLNCNVGRLFDNNGRTGLHLAAWRGHQNVVKLLIEFKANPNVRDSLGNTPALRAAWQGQTETLRYLLQHGANPDLQNQIGRSPLHVAAENGHLDCSKLLVRFGAHVDLGDRQGYSPVHSAAEKGLSTTLDVLIRSGAQVDLPTSDGRVTPLHISAGYGHLEAVRTLLKAGADAHATDHQGWSALHYAASKGCSKVVSCLLLTAGCDPHLLDDRGLSPVLLAACLGHHKAVVELLKDNKELPGATDEQAKLISQLQKLCQNSRRIHLDSGSSTEYGDSINVSPSDDKHLSHQLHQSLLKAGFSERSARAQTILADKLEKILQHRWNSGLHVMGSFAEAWGNSLRSLNGVTDLDADVDVVDINERLELQLHPRGFCCCGPDNHERILVDYERGHVMHSGVPSNVNHAYDGSTSRPSTDLIPAFRSCCYPGLQLPVPGRSQIHADVISKIHEAMKIYPPHLVASAEPNHEGQQLRFSTSFLERPLIRNLSSLQGQVFVIVKHLIKQVLAKRSVRGLKTYHVKTVFFYLLDETPEREWQPDNLVKLVRRALTKLLESLQSGTAQDSCMMHFFMPDCPLFLKKNHDPKRELASAVDELIQDLPYLLHRFMKKRLRLNGTNEGKFCFNPFLILPDPNPRPDHLWRSAVGQIDSCDIYNAVRSLWVRLSREADDSVEADGQSALMKEASRLPDCASTVRCCLKALICLKYGRTDEARSILSSFKATDSRFVRHEDLDSVSDVDAFVLNKLDTCDWAKKFCFVFSGRPQLEFLPKEINRHFPICILYVNVFSINFQALYRCLCLHLHVANESQAKSWFKEILEQDEAQLQEILVMLQFCKDREMLVSLIHKHRKAIYEQKHTFDMALNSMLADQQLMGLSTTRSLEETVHRLQQCNTSFSEDLTN